jgi:predicted Zn-dependent protease
VKPVVAKIWLVVLLVLLAGCAVNPVTGRKELALTEMSVEQEVELGRQAFGQALQSMGGIYPDDALNAYVERVGQRVARQSHRPELQYSFKVANDSTPNAFALPGGFIAITRGLLIHLENEAQLAAVLGHEIGHVTARHSLQGMQRSTLLGATVGLLGGLAANSGYGELVGQVGGITANLIDKRYSREQESESDLLGIDYMVRSGYAPQGAIELQEIFSRQIEKGQNPDWLSGLFRSHPFSQERLTANRDYVSRTYAATAATEGLDRGGYARAIQPLKNSSEAYALYDQARELEGKGELAAALETYHKAMQKAPDQALLQSGLGMAYLRKEDLIPARRYLLKAVESDSGYFQSRLGLGYIYLQNKQAPLAAEQLNASLQLLPTIQAAFLLAEAEQAQGNLAKARELYAAVASADQQGKLGKAAAERLQRIKQ